MDKAYKFERDRFNSVLYNFMGNYVAQEKRARVLGISQASMSRLENRQREPTISELVIICNESGYSPADFFRVVDEKS